MATVQVRYIVNDVAAAITSRAAEPQLLDFRVDAIGLVDAFGGRQARIAHRPTA